jgi:reactive intermediate/imine deaminase
VSARVGKAGGLWLATALVLASCTVEPRTDASASSRQQPATAEPGHFRTVVQPAGAARLPVFSTAIRHGDMLYLSGQLGALPGVSPPTVIEGGVEAETRQTFENIRSVLELEGLGFSNLIKCTVFLADIADYAAVNAVYATYFEGMDPPARSAVAGSGLALGAKVEIECIAAYPPGS